MRDGYGLSHRRWVRVVRPPAQLSKKTLKKGVSTSILLGEREEKRRRGKGFSNFSLTRNSTHIFSLALQPAVTLVYLSPGNAHFGWLAARARDG